MNRRPLSVAGAILCLAIFFPLATFAASCVAARVSIAPEERASLWESSIQQFAAAHSELSEDQLKFLSNMESLGTSLSSDGPVTRLKAAQLVAQAQGRFSTQQLGEIFSGMEGLQLWLVKVGALDTPYCNCSGSGPCTFSGGPTGTCKAGCISWDQNPAQTTRMDGLCSG
jgi:hypothetical protein